MRMIGTLYLDYWWIDWTIVGIFAFLVVASYVVSDKLFRPSWYHAHKNNTELCYNPPNLDGCWRIDVNRNGFGNPKSDLGLDYENVEFPCGPFRLSGNEILRGWFIPATDASNRELCVVVCHGGARDRRQHLRHVPTLRQCGAAVLLFDKQEHGLSDGCQRGIGWFSYEGSDVYAACLYAKSQRQFKRVVAMGSSFGAAGALTAAGYFDEAGAEQVIDGVIAENPPHSRKRFVRELVHKFGVELGLPQLLCEVLGFVSSMAIVLRRRAHFIPNPIDIVKDISPRPLLITHGEEDTIVPVQHGRDLYAAARAPKDFLWVPNCDHTMVFNVDYLGWSMKTKALLQQVMYMEGGMPVPVLSKKVAPARGLIRRKAALAVLPTLVGVVMQVDAGHT